ncbi:MAG: hypothetical protein ACYCO3_03105, partial [Mycobacteriales bacterium]
MTDWTTPRTAPVNLRRERTNNGVSEWAATLRQLDMVLLLAVGGLLLLGALLVWSATKPNSLLLGVGPNAYLKKDVLTVVVGVVLGGVAA